MGCSASIPQCRYSTTIIIDIFCIIIIAEMAVCFFNMAGYLIEERRRWPVITASHGDNNIPNKFRILKGRKDTELIQGSIHHRYHKADSRNENLIYNYKNHRSFYQVPIKILFIQQSIT